MILQRWVTSVTSLAVETDSPSRDNMLCRLPPLQKGRLEGDKIRAENSDMEVVEKNGMNKTKNIIYHIPGPSACPCSPVPQRGDLRCGRRE